MERDLKERMTRVKESLRKKLEEEHKEQLDYVKQVSEKDIDKLEIEVKRKQEELERVKKQAEEEKIKDG